MVIMDASLVVKRFHDFWKNGDFCDYKISTSDDVIFNVHKTYMAATSGYFYAMLNSTNTMIESQTHHVKLQNISSRGILPVLECMYGKADANISMDNMSDVLNAASMLQVKAALETCEAVLLTL